MKRILESAFVGVVVFASCLTIRAQATEKVSSVESDLTATNAPNNLSAIPPLPSGKSTIVGGAIRDVDPVLDRFTLKIAGEKPLRIVFDERTQVFVDGKKVSLRELRASDHASIQTTLDDTAVFAISVHILSKAQQGDYGGEVLSYDPSRGELEIVGGHEGESIRLRVTSATKFSREGQGSFTSARSGAFDLQKGALVSVQFDPDGKGHGSATEIAVLAIPGSRFIFSGKLTALDMHAGTMVILDPKDDHSYQIDFNSGTIASFPNVHTGQLVRVAAEYDGTRYLAHEVSAY
ncbi:MAG: hypothetical protein WBQ95_08855 [Terracidiphilus sp.]